MDNIVCRGLTKKFGEFTAVENMELRVAEGEMFGFLGPNGAGKTTTIKMMTGLLNPTSGTAEIAGFNIQESPLAAKALFGYIPDNPFLYDKLTGREYLNFMADLYSTAKKERDTKIEDLLRLFELQEKGDELIQSYSRGMRQKIALAGALVHSPRIIFLDEPTVGLDPRGARIMQDILRELTLRGTTVFMSTHILEVAERMCDRIAIVNRGKIIAQGTMNELRAERRRAMQNSVNEAGPGESGGSNATESEILKSLEEIFLELTGGDEHADLIQFLG